MAHLCREILRIVPVQVTRISMEGTRAVSAQIGRACVLPRSWSEKAVVRCGGGLFRQLKGPTFLRRGEVILNSRVPPPAFAPREIRRELHGKASLAVVVLLNPLAVPGMVGQRMRFEPAALPRIRAVSLLVEGQSH